LPLPGSIPGIFLYRVNPQGGGPAGIAPQEDTGQRLEEIPPTGTGYSNGKAITALVDWLPKPEPEGGKAGIGQ
jgi:hypothetical protein